MNNNHEVEAMAKRIRIALVSPITSDNVLDPHKDLAEILLSVGLKPSDCGGSITFEGKDPILKSRGLLRLWREWRLWQKQSAWLTCGETEPDRAKTFLSIYVWPPTGFVLFMIRSGNCLTALPPGVQMTRAIHSCPPICIRPATAVGCNFSTFTQRPRPALWPSLVAQTITRQ